MLDALAHQFQGQRVVELDNVLKVVSHAFQSGHVMQGWGNEFVDSTGGYGHGGRGQSNGGMH